MANRFSVEAVFKAVDRISAPVSRMQNRLQRFTRSASRNFSGLNRNLNRFVGGLGSAAKMAIKFGTGGAILGITAVSLALNKTADAADKLAKQSRRLEFPIEELQELIFVAEQSGVSTELLDNSLGAFTKRLGEAKGGLGPLVSGLKNINPELLAQLTATDSVSTAFDIYIKAIRNADTATEKAALANAAFSRSGLKLVDIAANSAATIEKLKLEQRANGNITQKQAEAAEAYNDALNSLKKSLTGLLQGVLLPMLPAITKTVTAWREWVLANKELVGAKILEFVQNLKDRIKSLIVSIQEFNNKYNLAERLGEGLDKLASFQKFLSSNAATIAKVTAAIVGLAIVVKTLVAVLTLVNLVMAANPISLIIIGVALLSAAIVFLINYFGGLEAIMVGAAASIVVAWSGLKDFFNNLWDGITSKTDAATARIMSIIDKVKNAFSSVTDVSKNLGGKVSGFFGFGDAPEQSAPASIVSPQDRVARSIEERSTTSTSEVTIKDETGRASVTRGRMGRGLTLQSAGAM
jgi:hypothetical protein